jgi:hypothetical protein
LVPALASDLAVGYDHAADTRIWIRRVQAAARQLQRTRHKFDVGRHYFFFSGNSDI